MTAFPTRDREALDLVCDNCGHRLPAIGSKLRDWDVVWALVSKHGWTGSRLAFGPHRCPQCARTVQSPIPHDTDVAAQAEPIP